MTQFSDRVLIRPQARKNKQELAVSSPLNFHQTLPNYAPSDLVEVPGIAAALGVGRVFVKDESQRFGMPAFKILGASYAISRALSARWGDTDRTMSFPELQQRAAKETSLHLIAATDGNHGRAVARMGKLLGLPVTIYIPHGLTEAAKEGIRSEGAELIEVPKSYDDVIEDVAAIHAQDNPDQLVIQDTAWVGYEQIPQWIVDGYHTLVAEIEEQLADEDIAGYDTIAVPAGVGSLAQAVVAQARTLSHQPQVVVVEPESAPGIIASLRAGEIVPVPAGETIMKGLNCGTTSLLAWPVLQAGADIVTVVTDAEAAQARDDLSQAGVDSGPCGASTLAAIRVTQQVDPALFDADDVVVLINTESRAANPDEAI